MVLIKKLNSRIIIVVTILVIIIGVIWVTFKKMDIKLSTETQKQENPSVPPINVTLSESINPYDFREVTLDSRFEYYVMAAGVITFHSDRSSEVTIVILPGTLRYDAQTLPKDPQNKMVYGNYGDYSYTFNAPLIPGVYKGVIVTRTNDKDGKKPESKNFKLTVVNEIKNEAEAYTVAEHFLYTKLTAGEHVNVKGWTEQHKDILLTDGGWKVSLGFDYQSCGIDWKENVCVPQQAKAVLFVRKNGILEQIK